MPGAGDITHILAVVQLFLSVVALVPIWGICNSLRDTSKRLRRELDAVRVMRTENANREPNSLSQSVTDETSTENGKCKVSL